MSLENLSAAPIVEAAISVEFDKNQHLNPARIGVFWNSIREEFPDLEFHEAIRNVSPQGGASPIVLLRIDDLRLWCLSKDKSLLIQIQDDRFIVNWRASKTTGYPRFSTEKGLLNRFLSLFEKFSSFYEQEFNAKLKLRRTEVTKVDRLDEGLHWSSWADLKLKLPGVAEALNVHSENSHFFQMSFTNDVGAPKAIQMTLIKVPEGGRSLQVTSTIQHTDQTVNGYEISSLKPLFLEMNLHLNSFFDWLVPKKTRDKILQTGIGGKS